MDRYLTLANRSDSSDVLLQDKAIVRFISNVGNLVHQSLHEVQSAAALAIGWRELNVLWPGKAFAGIPDSEFDMPRLDTDFDRNVALRIGTVLHRIVAAFDKGQLAIRNVFLAAGVLFEKRAQLRGTAANITKVAVELKPQGNGRAGMVAFIDSAAH